MKRLSQDYTTIRQILDKDVNVGIISNIDLSHQYQTVSLLGVYQGMIENSQLVYGIIKEQLCFLGKLHNEKSVIFKETKKPFQLINTTSGPNYLVVETIFTDFKLFPNNTKEKNYSEFDGIKFQLI